MPGCALQRVCKARVSVCVLRGKRSCPAFAALKSPPPHPTLAKRKYQARAAAVEGCHAGQWKVTCHLSVGLIFLFMLSRARWDFVNKILYLQHQYHWFGIPDGLECVLLVLISELIISPCCR